MSFSDDLFWNDVSGDHERTQRTAALTHGKVAVAGYWPFLSSALTEQDFENRLELSLDRIASLVGPDVLDEVVSSLRDDYRAVTGAKGDNPFAKKDDKDSDKDSDDDSDDDDDDSDDDDDDKDDDKSDKDKDDSDDDSDDKDDDDKYGQGAHEKDFPHLYSKRRASYVPDPSDAGRYYAPYETLTQPVNNGDLQGPDGYIEDLAAGEDRSNPKIEQQITPGTWTLGDGMPERPMPFSQQRGYQPVAGYKDIDKKGCPDCGAKWVNGKLQHAKNCPTLKEFDPTHESSLRFDKEGFLIEARDYAEGENIPTPFINVFKDHKNRHRVDLIHSPSSLETVHSGYDQGEALNRAYQLGADHGIPVYQNGKHLGSRRTSVVDPVPGAPLASNPFFFGTGSEGLEGEGFPQAPSQDPTDRVNEFYGDQQPGQSSGSQEGYSDGKGYSRSTPGETVASRRSPNFNRQAGAASEFFNTIWDSEKSRRQNREHPAIQQARQQYEDDVAAFGGHHNADADHQMDKVITARYEPDTGAYVPSHEEERAAESGSCTCPWSSANRHGDPERIKVDPSCEVHGHLRESSRKNAATDGRIVDKCPGCDKPRRVHKTPHGDELHHLHNDHVRCFGKSALLEELPELAEGGEGGGLKSLIPGMGGGSKPKTSDGAPDAGWAADMSQRMSSISPFFDPNELSKVGMKYPGPGASDFDLGKYHGWFHKQEGMPPAHKSNDPQVSDSFFSKSNDYQHGYRQGWQVNGYESSKTAADYIGRPDAFNPTGRGDDEYRARTWNAYETTRPMQTADDRNVNTPVKPAEPLRTRQVNSPNPGENLRNDRLEQSTSEDDEGEED